MKGIGISIKVVSTTQKEKKIQTIIQIPNPNIRETKKISELLCLKYPWAFINPITVLFQLLISQS